MEHRIFRVFPGARQHAERHSDQHQKAEGAQGRNTQAERLPGVSGDGQKPPSRYIKTTKGIKTTNAFTIARKHSINLEI
jgi:hypothetical protein